MEIKVKKELEKTLKYFKGVKAVEIPLLNLRRYCFNSKPFVVFSSLKNGKEVLHIKLPFHKCYELLSRFSDYFTLSTLYDSVRWISFAVDNLTQISKKADIYNLLIISYKTILNELNILDTQKYLCEFSIDYDVNVVSIQEAFSKGIIGN